MNRKRNPYDYDRVFKTYTFCAFLILALNLLGAPAVDAAVENVPAPRNAPEIANDELLNTLNETLEENRGLREKYTTLQESFQNQTRENNVLQSQVRSLKRRLEAQDALRGQASQEMKGKQDEIDRLRKKIDEKDGLIREKEHELESSQDEVSALNKKLNESILESDRDLYLELIDKNQHQADEAVRELARQSYEKITMQQDLAATYYQLGNISFEQNDFAKAVEYYHRALDLNPKLAWAHYNLGVIYDYHLNDSRLSLYHYRKYLKLEPEEDSALTVQERIAELNLLKNMVPEEPLKNDFMQQHQRRM